ncbi:unnamed protein product [Orchesella dallaii]|uniref:Gustatory receptor n=1 Tax=Orchesella dallaii TaxID=48710 RepID=A0ABP1R5F7_9HEXA
MLFGLTVGSTAFVLIREVFKPSPRISAIQLAIIFYIGLCSSISWGVCLAFHNYWSEIVFAFNQFAKFEEYWGCEPAAARRPKTHYLRIWKCSREELTGMSLNMLIIGIGVVAIPIGMLAGVVTNLDPYFLVVEDSVAEQSAFLKVLVFVCRLLIGYISGIEAMRFMLMTLILTFSIGLVMEKLLKNILQSEVLSEAYQNYQLVWLQYHLIKSPFNNVMAISSVIGFFGATTMIWLSFNAWNYVTRFLAAMYPFVALGMLLVILVGISLQVSIVEKSKSFIYKWKKESLFQSGIRRSKETRLCRMFGRTLRSLPVACGSCYGINSNTPFSFLQILMKAVTDSLLGIQM